VLFFQAEDGIRDRNVTGVQTCALPISRFTAKAGVDDEVSPASAASVVFQVWGDGEKLYDSGLITAEDDAKAVDVDIAGVNELKQIGRASCRESVSIRVRVVSSCARRES